MKIWPVAGLLVSWKDSQMDSGTLSCERDGHHLLEQERNTSEHAEFGREQVEA